MYASYGIAAIGTIIHDGIIECAKSMRRRGRVRQVQAEILRGDGLSSKRAEFVVDEEFYAKAGRAARIPGQVDRALDENQKRASPPRRSDTPPAPFVFSFTLHLEASAINQREQEGLDGRKGTALLRRRQARSPQRIFLAAR
jgi:hypothetical protein